MRACLLALILAVCLTAQTSRVLYFTHSAGFRHDSIPVSVEILRQMTSGSGELEIEWTEDVAAISEANLSRFAAVVFFTSGEIPFTTDQKRALLEFISRGGGFAGVHSASDTLYSWPEYGRLLGGYFDGHPWTQQVRIDIEDPENPVVGHLGPGFDIAEEIYQFRDLSRERVRVLMTLDTASVDPKAPGAHGRTTDFPLAWTRLEGEGRVFYTALGHFEQTWRDPRFQQIVLQGLRWITRRFDADGTPRALDVPFAAAVANAASFEPVNIVAPGSLISIFGQNLTAGSRAAASGSPYLTKLAGTAVSVNGKPATLLYSSPEQLNVLAPADLEPGSATVEVTVADRTTRANINVVAAAPGIFAATHAPGAVTLWATGLGRSWDRAQVTVGGRDARVLWVGMTPWPGLYQINVGRPSDVAAGPATIRLTVPQSEYTGTIESLLP